MKKEYETPDLEIVSFSLPGVLSDIIHSSFEHGGNNSGWTFDDDDDDDNFGDLTP
ncbi:MAG: hypothetical protein IJV48_06635 [Ruminococcus sp.]|nr:hypothetical protein [Ruminococcus sp.]